MHSGFRGFGGRKEESPFFSRKGLPSIQSVRAGPTSISEKNKKSQKGELPGFGATDEQFRDGLETGDA